METVPEFDIKDIKSLYGNVIYIADQVAYDPNAIEWKVKQNGRVTFILERAEFADKSLTNLLKNIVESLNIPTDAVNFGIIKMPFTSENLQTMPTKIGIALTFNNVSEANPFLLNGKEIYFAPNLQSMLNDKQKKMETWETIKMFKDRI